MYYLGARTIFLLGVDFRMAEGYGYSFEQGRTEGAVRSNNAQFSVVNRWLVEMQESGVFKQFGLSIYNTYRNSGGRYGEDGKILPGYVGHELRKGR